jgi:hypothetical protein
VEPGKVCDEEKGWKKQTKNGKLMMCCPEDATNWMTLKSGVWDAGCNCDDPEKTFDKIKAQCL